LDTLTILQNFDSGGRTVPEEDWGIEDAEERRASTLRISNRRKFYKLKLVQTQPWMQ
jgi:hypothetical protein